MTVGLVAVAAITLVAQPLASVSSQEFADKPVKLANGIVGELTRFESRSPADFAPMLSGRLGPRVVLNAQLFRPRDCTSCPAVVFVPGSGNIGPHHLAQASALTDSGLAVLLIDPFRGRGIDETISDQEKLSWAASTFDVIAAVRHIRTLRGIDEDRVGAAGNSRGGTAVMLAAAEPISLRFLGKSNIKAIVAGYPWCGTQFWSAKLAPSTSMLVLSGAKDDWVSVQQCQDAVHAIDRAGGSARINLFPGAYHAFDRHDMPLTRLEQVSTALTYPTVYMDDRGHYLNPQTGEPDPALGPAYFVQDSIAGKFGKRGVTIGTHGTQARDYIDALVAFLSSQLQPTSTHDKKRPDKKQGY